jgi:hypothetical protein
MNKLAFIVLIIIFFSACATGNGLALPTELNEKTWLKYVNNFTQEKDTCRGTALTYNEVWWAYNTPGTMNLREGVDPNSYLSELKTELDSLKNKLDKICDNKKLKNDLDVLEKAGIDLDFQKSIYSYLNM